MVGEGGDEGGVEEVESDGEERRVERVGGGI